MLPADFTLAYKYGAKLEFFYFASFLPACSAAVRPKRLVAPASAPCAMSSSPTAR